MTEAERAHSLLVVEGVDQYAAARIMNAEQPHGSKRQYTFEDVQRLARQEQDRRMGRA